ncbi:hypothetical protein H0H92_009627 [Tricholoma furcatifolium]|nr:hypothetical protein H0H92_009627 [Tricholoma furcatifolium]
MGASQSSTSEHHPPSKALHVLRVTPSSPASQTSIEPFFDFVVGFEGDSLSNDNAIDVSQLEKIVEAHEGRTLNLLVWSGKSLKTRVVPIRPSRDWSQSANLTSPSASQPSLLGLSMRMCEPETATENVWHVLDVIEGSPAESAGLVPMGDWILGWSGGVLGAENDFYDLVEAAFAFRFGLLHRIPPQPEDRLPGSIPPELQEAEAEYEDQELFVPADVQPEVPYSHEQLQEWQRQEREEWHRETAARSNYNFHDQSSAHLAKARYIGHQHDHENGLGSHEHHHDHDHEETEHDQHFDHEHNGHYHPTLDEYGSSDISVTPTLAPHRASMNGLS